MNGLFSGISDDSGPRAPTKEISRKALIAALALASLVATSAVAKTEKVHPGDFGRQSSQRIALILGVAY